MCCLPSKEPGRSSVFTRRRVCLIVWEQNVTTYLRCRCDGSRGGSISSRNPHQEEKTLLIHQALQHGNQEFADVRSLCTKVWRCIFLLLLLNSRQLHLMDINVHCKQNYIRSRGLFTRPSLISRKCKNTLLNLENKDGVMCRCEFCVDCQAVVLILIDRTKYDVTLGRGVRCRAHSLRGLLETMPHTLTPTSLPLFEELYEGDPFVSFFCLEEDLHGETGWHFLTYKAMIKYIFFSIFLSASEMLKCFLKCFSDFLSTRSTLYVPHTQKHSMCL